MLPTFLLLVLLQVTQAANNVTVLTTWFGAKDNCPPGGDIAYPHIHQAAGGTGNWEDPITFAGAKSAIKPGSKVYVPSLKKYFIMEDDCEECDGEWKKHKKWHMDLWMGTDKVTPGSGLIACENQMTVNKATVTLEPDSTYPVDTTAIFDGNRKENNGCIVHSDPCTDTSDDCGNECSIPNSGTCEEWAKTLYLNMTRFKQLNKHLDCSKKLKAGTDVCMGGNCGD